MRFLAVVIFLAVAPTALAQANPAADHYNAGVARFKAGQYSEAIQEFRAADAIRPGAALSFNIAQCYEKMADLQNAKAAYQDYLRRAPNADDRAAVEATITSIDQKLAEKQNDSVVLIPATPEVKATEPAKPANYTVGIVTGAVGILGLGAAVVLNAVAVQQAGSLGLNGAGGHGFATQSTLQGYYNNAQTLWTGAIIAYIAGGALTATGVGILGYEYFTRPPSP